MGLLRGVRLPCDTDGWLLAPVFAVGLFFFFVGGATFDIFETTAETQICLSGSHSEQLKIAAQLRLLIR